MKFFSDLRAISRFVLLFKLRTNSLNFIYVLRALKTPLLRTFWKKVLKNSLFLMKFWGRKFSAEDFFWKLIYSASEKHKNTP